MNVTFGSEAGKGFGSGVIRDVGGAKMCGLGVVGEVSRPFGTGEVRGRRLEDGFSGMDRARPGVEAPDRLAEPATSFHKGRIKFFLVVFGYASCVSAPKALLIQL